MDFDVGSQRSPWYITSADFDNDGDIDVATANPLLDISVLLNDGNATFQVSDVYPVAGFPVFLFTADYDQDNFLDISVASDSNLYVFFNNGDATLSAPDIYYTPYPTRPGERAWSIANADVNLDGFIDMVVSNVTGGSFAVLLNDQDANFDSIYHHDTFPASPEHLSTCDFDNDGDVDILFADKYGKIVHVYQNNDGIFSFQFSLFTQGELNSIYCNDFTNDNVVDILVGTGYYSPTDDRVIMIYNEGSGFQIDYYTLLTNPNYAVGADFNSDGFQDVVCVHNVPVSNNNVSILLNDQAGLLGAPHYWGNYTYSPFAVSTADFNNDQTIDFVVANAGGGNISVFLNHPAASVEEPHLNNPIGFKLYQDYPNPFNPETVISYQLAVGRKVELSVYNMLGQKVHTLVKERQRAGQHEVVWDGRDNAGREVSSGVYVYQLEAGERVQSRKMLLLR